jgi:hypothetical protein
MSVTWQQSLVLRPHRHCMDRQLRPVDAYDRHDLQQRNPAKTGIAGKFSKSPWPLIRKLHEERFGAG